MRYWSKERMKAVEVPSTQLFTTEDTEKERRRKERKGQKELQKSDDGEAEREGKQRGHEGADALGHGVPHAGGVGSACRDLAGMAA